MAVDFQMFACDRAGVRYASLYHANVDKVVRRLYPEIGTLHFTLPVNDPAMPIMQTLATEIQVWINGRIWWVGTINRDTTDFVAGDFQCEEIMWWWAHRRVGKANRTNYLTNGSFDTGSLAPWEAVGSGLGTNIVSAWGWRAGTYQLNLNQSGPPLTGEDTFVRQHVTNPLAGRTLWTASAWYHIRADSDWVGPSREYRGLYLENLNSAGNQLIEAKADRIDENTERGQYHHTSVTIFSNQGENLWVRLYAIRTNNSGISPPGGIIWDNAKLVVMESLSFSRADLRDIVAGLVAHGQDPAYGKSGLNIGTDATMTGLFLDKAYQHADHPVIADAFRDLVESGLCDLDTVYSANGAIRNVKVYSPRKGTLKPEYTVMVGRNAVSIQRLRDGTQVKNTIVATGQGGGPDQDEGFASDTSSSFGIVMEDVISAPEDTPYDLLANAAAASLAASKDPDNIPKMVVLEEQAHMIHNVEPGDSVPVYATFAPGVTLNGNFRIIEMAYDPNSHEIELTVNP